MASSVGCISRTPVAEKIPRARRYRIENMATRGLYVFKHDSELGNAHSHALFDRLAVVPTDPATPARDISAYGVTFDGLPMTVGQEIQAAPGVTLIRRC